MDRKKDLEEYIQEYKNERMQIKKSFLEKNISKMQQTFLKSISILIDEQLQRQTAEESVKLKYIFLCKLMSSGYTESYEAVLGMSSDMLYLDEKKSQVYWYPELIYENITQDMDNVEKLLRKKYTRIEEFELFYIKQSLLSDDWKLLQECYKDLIKPAMDLLMESPLRLETPILFLSGNYMDNLKIMGYEDTERGKE